MERNCSTCNIDADTPRECEKNVGYCYAPQFVDWKPMKELTTEQKTDVLSKLFSSLGMTAEEYVNALTERMAEPEIDPYLQPGCVAEIWDDKEIKHLQYFARYFNEKPQFYTDSNDGNIGNYTWKNYRVVGTEWEHAPEWACIAEIDDHGQCIFYSHENELRSPLSIPTVLPDRFKNKTIPRPAWAI